MTGGVPSVGAAGYARSAALAAMARTAPLVVQLAATPFVIGSAGVSSYAVWAILMTTINLLLTADLGVVGVMQRFHSLARGRGDPALGARVTSSVLLVLCGLLVIMAVAGPLIGRLVISVVRVDPGVAPEALTVFANAGVIAVLQLMGLALSSYLAAHERFAAMAVASLGARAVAAVVIVIALTSRSGLDGLLIAAYVDAAMALFLAAVFSARHLVFEVRRPVHRREARALWAFAWRNQASALGFVAQRESDLVMASILLPAVAQATVASGAQLAAAASLAPTVLLVPLFSSLSRIAGRSVPDAVDELPRAESNWFAFLLPFAAVVMVALPPFAAAWVGPDLPAAYAVTAILSAGFLVALINSARAVLVRSIGRPGLETLSFVVVVVVKLVVGIPAAIYLGVIGLVATTILAAAAGAVTLWVGSTRSIPGLRAGRVGTSPLILAAVILAAGLPIAWLMHELLPRWPSLGASILLAVTAAGIAAVVTLGARGARGDARPRA
ncbi:hypothetical protein [Pseudolysinimonas sp.]|uniref:hypothetical protein n=1 Tax=Pseudolysinimonas sp. TaxID=2680009 RepID=UPI003F7ED8A6